MEIVKCYMLQTGYKLSMVLSTKSHADKRLIDIHWQGLCRRFPLKTTERLQRKSIHGWRMVAYNHIVNTKRM